MSQALAGVRAYQAAERAEAPPERPIVARAGRAVLRSAGGSGPAVVFVPSLINPPSVLDLPGRSLLGWLAANGFSPFVVDWGPFRHEDRALNLGAHALLAAELLDWFAEPPALAGYCLGGTLALAVAALRPVARLALLAAPWRFGGFGDAARASIEDTWEQARGFAEQEGYLPMEVLQAGFWQLDPARTVAKFERFATLDPASDVARRFVALEDWANAGTPIPFAAARELHDDLFAADLTGQARWQVDGHAIKPAVLTCPILDVISTTDRIVPAASAAGVGLEMRLGEGHVGMVVGGRAERALWTPLARWLSGAQPI